MIDQCCEQEGSNHQEDVLRTLSNDGLIEAFSRMLASATKELVFYQKKTELLSQAIEKLKS